MQQSVNLKNVDIEMNRYRDIQEKLLKSESDYKEGKTRKAEDVFKEWKTKYGI